MGSQLVVLIVVAAGAYFTIRTDLSRHEQQSAHPRAEEMLAELTTNVASLATVAGRNTEDMLEQRGELKAVRADLRDLERRLYQSRTGVVK